MKKDTFCSYCGAKFFSATYPKECKLCNHITYINPLPVVVACVPVNDGLLVVKRNHDPGKGQLALPGGYLEVGESWQEGVVREIFEETGVVLSTEDIDGTWDVYTSPITGHLVIYAVCKKVLTELPEFTPNDEIADISVITEPVELAFPRHTYVAKMYFDYLRSSL